MTLDRFDIGYFQNNKVVGLRCAEDISNLMASLQKGQNTLLWCDGLWKAREKTAHRPKGKSSTVDSSDSDDENICTKRKKDYRNEKVQCQIEGLKEKHGSTAYTSLQYCIWAELLSGGVYNSTSEPLTHSTMFS